MSSQLCGMPARLPRMHSGHRFMRNIKLMIPTRTDRSPSVPFFISGDFFADFYLHTPTVKRVQTHICCGDFDTSEHFFISGDVFAVFYLHTAMAKRVQTHICCGDVDTSEHFLFYLGWRFCGFWSSYPDGEISAVLRKQDPTK